MNKRDCLVCFFVLMSLGAQLMQVWGRSWTNKEGVTIEAELVERSATHVKLDMRGRIYDVPVDSLSELDQQYLEALEKREQERLKALHGYNMNYVLHTPLFLRGRDYFQTSIQRAYKKAKESDVPPEGASHVDDAEKVMEIAPREHSAVCYVPDNYDGETPFALYIHMSPSDDGIKLGNYKSLFKEKKMIMISPHKTANDVQIMIRQTVALAALATARKDFKLDEDRIYIGGYSGGGITAVQTAMLYPDLFDGVFSHARGVFLDFHYSEDGGRYYLGVPSGVESSDYDEIAEQPIKWAFLSGPGDFNYEHSKVSVKQFEGHGFNVRFFEDAGMKHTNAPVSLFRESLEWVEN